MLLGTRFPARDLDFWEYVSGQGAMAQPVGIRGRPELDLGGWRRPLFRGCCLIGVRLAAGGKSPLQIVLDSLEAYAIYSMGQGETSQFSMLGYAGGRTVLSFVPK